MDKIVPSKESCLVANVEVEIKKYSLIGLPCLCLIAGYTLIACALKQCSTVWSNWESWWSQTTLLMTNVPTFWKSTCPSSLPLVASPPPPSTPPPSIDPHSQTGCWQHVWRMRVSRSSCCWRCCCCRRWCCYCCYGDCHHCCCRRHSCSLLVWAHRRDFPSRKRGRKITEFPSRRRKSTASGKIAFDAFYVVCFFVFFLFLLFVSRCFFSQLIRLSLSLFSTYHEKNCPETRAWFQLNFPA